MVAVNVVILPIMTYLGMQEMREQEAQRIKIGLLRTQLLTDKATDRAKFQAIWARLGAEVEGVEVRVLSEAKELARRYSDTPTQLAKLEDSDALLAEAKASEFAMHEAMRTLVVKAGGLYEQGPLKKKERVEEKMYADCESGSPTFHTTLSRR